jgi:hypothetical protein
MSFAPGILFVAFPGFCAGLCVAWKVESNVTASNSSELFRTTSEVRIHELKILRQ